MRPWCLLLCFLAFSSTVYSSEGGGKKKKDKNAGNLYLLTITVGTHDPKGTPDDWNYTGQELERIIKAQSGPLFREVKSNLVKGSDATPLGVLKGIAWLKDNVTEHDLALVYIGAHGGSNATRGFALFANGGTVYGDQIKPALAKVKGPVILVIQACSAGDILVKHRKDLQALPNNVAAICACKAGQTSHGILLPPIMEGLHGFADGNKDGVVSVGEFLRYIEHRVSDFYPENIQQAALAAPKDFDLSMPLAKTMPPMKLGKDVVLIQLKNVWFGGVILPKKDPTKKGRHWVHYFGDKAGDEDWVEPERICPHDAEAVIVKSGDKWYTAVLLKHEGNRFRIRYVGAMGNREELIPRDRIWAFSLDVPAEKKEKAK